MPGTHSRGKQDAAVQGTNDSSVVSKVSAATQGYFHDEFLQHFVCKSLRRAPLINRGYYVRWKAVDHCVKQFLHVTDSCSRRQILSLGAGFDSLYFRLHAEKALQRAVVFEVDFPDVSRRKAALIRGSSRLKDALSDWDLSSQTDSAAGPVYVSSAQYNLLGLDLRNGRMAEEVLRVAGLQHNIPSLVLSEVVLTYMETSWSDAVIGWVAGILPQALFVMYEQICPDDPFGKVMQSHFLKLNSKIHALCQYPDTAAQTQRFLQKGWDKSVCMDMNQFYFSLAEVERERMEKLEPFDEFEEWHQKCSHYFILTASKGPLTSPALLSPATESPIPRMVPKLEAISVAARPIAGTPCVEGAGMASTLLEPSLLLLTGGYGRGGRNTGAVALIRGEAGWRCALAELNGERDVRMYHTLTSVPGWGAVVIGGRTSPRNPIDSILRITHCLSDEHDPKTMQLSVEKMVCTGEGPKARWRHTTTLLSQGDRNLLFVFGGHTERESVLGDAHFLCLEKQHWMDIPVEGSFPEPRHSHSACACGEGLVMFGGLGGGGVPLGDAVLLKPTPAGFCWERLHLQPALVPRYSHSAHVIGENLVVVGGVWLQADRVPGVAVINLATGGSIEVSIDTSSVPWPLMLHSFCSELLDPDGAELVLIGGGGNCFSFGMHLNAHPVILDLRPVLQNSTQLLHCRPSGYWRANVW
ncbi:tRNA wybutosine-synthesizing protein 4 isoform X2 [Electrophorus electricus]|uniref:tRNA wybutosine-synthesizing protein 4 isoform X2 n=1 Tax=Electrophorus electricus TaxID=8005 RepID=UPI0015D02107|nr:tRNA wybutosine-synthesizing protein 4 isoform X2 [Electrophorus electricus]